MTAARQAVGDSGERQNLIRTISRKGYRFIGEVREEHGLGNLGAAEAGPTAECNDITPTAPHRSQSVTFCRTKDGINLAVASVGRGPVLVRAAHWPTNIDYDWQSPITGPLLQRLAARFCLVRYDGRGTGLSDWNVSSLSLQTFVDDLETVADSLPLEPFALLGISGGAAASIAYAVRYPHRVSKLVLYGSYALGSNKRGSPQEVDDAKAFLTMARGGWVAPARAASRDERPNSPSGKRSPEWRTRIELAVALARVPQLGARAMPSHGEAALRLVAEDGHELRALAGLGA
jgi:pimeloyl-ACP methyl ester carboxylesterase